MQLPRVRKRDLVILSLYGLALSMAANVLDPPLFTAKVNQLVSDDGWRNTVLGLITFLGLLLAAFAQPIWGALSDGSNLRWGRRVPFLIAGSLANLFFFVFAALAGNVWLLGLAVLLIQLANNAILGAYQGLIPDQVPDEQYGVAAGIKGLVEMPGVIIGPLVAGLILGLEGWSVTGRALAIAGVLQAIYLTVALITLRRVRDQPIPSSVSPSGEAAGIWRTVRDTFRVDWRARRDLQWWLLNRFLFWFALLTLRTFLINYVEQVMGLSPAEAQRTTGLLSAILGVLIFLVVLPSGYIADRVGRRRLVMGAGILAAAGTLVLLSVRSLPLMFGAGILIGLGGGLFVTSSWALATELVPKADAARYLGLTNLATAGGSAAARLTGPLIDGLNRTFASQTVGYVGVYALSALFFLISVWAIHHVTQK